MQPHPILPAPRIRQARAQLIEHGAATADGLAPFVSRSWHRSLAAGLSPVGRISAIDNLSATELQRMRSLHHELISHSLPIMEYLLEQASHSQSMVILSDHQGMLMHTLGDLDFLNKAERVALTCGASWNESQRGTNAIGTALAEKAGVEIHGGEHFLERNGFLTCAAVPIMSASGGLLGILDLSGDQRERHPHTLGLVRTAARMIENRLVLSGSRDKVLVALHARPEGIGTIAQGMLVFSHDGWLVGANQRGLEALQIPPATLGAATWEQLFACDWSGLLARQARQSERPFALRTASGHAWYAQVRARPQISVGPPSAPAAANAPAASAPAPAAVNALARLDTGDAAWRRAAEKALRVCDKDIPLLLTGESGVGKELFARAVHDSSARRGKPFVAINCAAIPEHLIESELFGHVPGAFTGAARHGSPGRLREASGGTLLLDEIGDMPLGLQTRLLRVLQDRQVTPLGSGQPVPVDFALICATHHDLRQAAEQGTFRADLYYRINGLALRLPALRERDDFAALTRRLLHELGQGDEIEIDQELLQALSRHHWPGNLRQYSHVLKTAIALLEPHQVHITWPLLPEDLADELRRAAAPRHGIGGPPPQSLQALSHKAILQALENCRGNVSAAARQLGISRQTLYRRLGKM